MLDIQVIDDPAAATVALEPIRSRLLSELAAPASAATLATRVGLARQKVHYHLHALEAHGLVRLAGPRQATTIRGGANPTARDAGRRAHPDRTQSRGAAFRVAPYFHDLD